MNGVRVRAVFRRLEILGFEKNTLDAHFESRRISVNIKSNDDYGVLVFGPDR